MIRPCTGDDFAAIYAIINDAAQAYRAVIPDDRWKEPYMPEEELRDEIADGVEFWGYEEDGELLGVMGIQQVKDVTLIRHAYVRTRHRNRGIGSKLLAHLRTLSDLPVLIGGDVGDPVLREARLPRSDPTGEEPPPEDVLEGPRPAD